MTVAPRTSFTLLGVVFALVAFGLWWSGTWRFGDEPPIEQPHARQPEPVVRAVHVAKRQSLPKQSDADVTDNSDESVSGFKTALLFDDRCVFGAGAHCREWTERATECDAGDVEACVVLGELLLGESPMQPHWGALVLQRACELGNDDACARSLRWNEWSRYGYRAEFDPDEAVPAGLDAACTDGDQVACGLLQMRQAKQGQSDSTVAMASCQAGFRDVCTTIASKTEDVDLAVSALTAACELPDAYGCFYLATLYMEDCADTFQASACPEPDSKRVSHFKALSCQLDSALAHCGE